MLEVRAQKRACMLAEHCWRTMEEEAKLTAQIDAQHAAQLQQQRAAGKALDDYVDELPSPPPVGCVVSIMPGSEFLSLHSAQQLLPTVHRWLACLEQHAEGGKTLLLLVHGLYMQVQMEANQAMAQKRTAYNGGTAATAAVKPTLKKLTDVDALLAQIWFQTKGKVRFKMVSSQQARTHATPPLVRLCTDLTVPMLTVLTLCDVSLTTSLSVWIGWCC